MRTRWSKDEEKRFCVVLMPFNEASAWRWQMIRDTLEASGFRVMRVDHATKNESHVAAIIRSIQQADLIVADLTGNNPNVLWELGVARGLRKQFVLVSDTADPDKVAFDVRAYFIHVYTQDSDVRHWEELSEAAQRIAPSDHIAGPIGEALGQKTVYYGQKLIGLRTRASLIDLALGMGIAMIGISIDQLRGAEDSLLGSYLFLAAVAVNMVGITFIFGGSLGKLLTGLRVVTLRHENPSFLQLCGRLGGYFLVWITYFLGMKDAWKWPEYRGLHEQISGTAVIKTEES